MLPILALTACGGKVPPQPPAPVCYPDLTSLGWAVAGECSTSERVLKEQIPGRLCPSVVTPCEPTLAWSETGEQLIVSWLDFPRVVYGGSEDWVLRRESRIPFESPRILRYIQSFIGVDRGDVGEFHILVTGFDGVKRYGRSEHHELADENYDAISGAASLSDTATDGVTIELLCRATGENHNPYAYPRESALSVFCHEEVTLFFEVGDV